MEKLETIKYLVIHHSQREIDSAKSIKKRHLKRGWEDIGYHYIINKNGRITKGRNTKYIGAHVKGHNRNSLGICIIGNFDKEKPTEKQIKKLLKFLKRLSKKHNIENKNILGHREFKGVTKTCPGKNIDLKLIRKNIKS